MLVEKGLVAVCYRCYHCEAEKWVAEDVPDALGIQEMEKWNICLDCLRKAGQKSFEGIIHNQEP